MYFFLEYTDNILTLNDIDVDGGDNFVLDFLQSDLCETDDCSYVETNSNNLTLLNNCIGMLETMGSDYYKHRASLFTFLNEAATHKEYCDPFFLKSFGSCLEGVLTGWEDGTAHDFDLGYKEYNREPVTSDDIREAYNRMREQKDASKHDFYTCRFVPVSSDEAYIRRCYYTSIPIQIIYSVLLHHFKQGHIIKRCENCGRFFIPSRTSDIYCRNLTNGKTCGEIRKAEAQKRSHDKEINKVYKRIDNRLYQREAFAEQKEFRDGFKQCPTEEQQRHYLNQWDSKTYKRKPNKERQDTDNGKREKE